MGILKVTDLFENGHFYNSQHLFENGFL